MSATEKLSLSLAEEVAAHLGFTVAEACRGWYLDGPAGERLLFTLDWRNGERASVVGIYPADPPYGIGRHGIGVGSGRPAKAIAGEITRRLLPAYREDLARVVADKQDREAMAESRTALAEVLAGLLHGTVDKASTRHDSSTGVRFYRDGLHGRLTVNYRAEDVALDLHGVPVAMAVRICELIGAVL